MLTDANVLIAGNLFLNIEKVQADSIEESKTESAEGFRWMIHVTSQDQKLSFSRTEITS
jgi:hypothetical protein